MRLTGWGNRAENGLRSRRAERIKLGILLRGIEFVKCVTRASEGIVRGDLRLAD